jgi:hypothetical protein
MRLIVTYEAGAESRGQHIAIYRSGFIVRWILNFVGQPTVVRDIA